MNMIRSKTKRKHINILKPQLPCGKHDRNQKVDTPYQMHYYTFWFLYCLFYESDGFNGIMCFRLGFGRIASIP